MAGFPRKLAFSYFARAYATEGRHVYDAITSPSGTISRMEHALQRSKNGLYRTSASSVFVCLLGLLSVPALAQAANEEPLPFSLDYETPSACPDRDEAFKLIRKRSKRVVLTEQEDAAQHLHIRVAQTPGGFEGELAVTRNDEATDSRRFTGSTCVEVVDALALTAALSLDPDATIVAPAATGSDPSEPESPTSDKSKLPGEASTDPSDPSTRENTRGPQAGAGAATDPRASHGPHGWHVSAGLQGSIERVMDTSLHAGFGLSAGLRRNDDRTWFPLEFAVDVRYLAEVARSEDELTTRLALARFSYCLLRVGSVVTFLACPTAQLGLLVAQGENLETTSAVTRLYATAGAQARVRGIVYKQLEWQFMASINLPFVPRHFAVDPGPTVIGSTLPVAFDGALALSWVF